MKCIGVAAFYLAAKINEEDEVNIAATVHIILSKYKNDNKVSNKWIQSYRRDFNPL